MNRRVLVNVAVALALALVAGIYWQWVSNRQGTVEADNWETHSFRVMQQLQGLLADLKDAQTSERGFVITGNTNYLAPYQAALGQVEQKLAALKSMTADNPQQQRRLAAMEPLLRESLALVRAAVEARQRQGFEAAQAVVLTGRGQALMDELNRQMAAMQAEEARLLRERTEHKEAHARRAFRNGLLGGIFSCTFFLTAVWLLQRENRRRRAVERQLREHQDKLEELVAERTGKLQRSEARLVQAVRVGRLGIFEHDQVADVLELSPEMRELLNFGAREAATLAAFLERVPPEDREGLVKAIERAHDPAGDGSFAIEYRVALPAGGVRWVSVRSQTFFEGEGSRRRAVRTIGAALDITEAKESQARLERLVAERTGQLAEANANLQNFAYTAAHDLRSPLRGISSFVGLTLEQYGPQLDEMGRSMLERAVESAAQMGQLLNDLLEYSKTAQGELRLERVDLEAAVQEVLALEAEDIRAKGAEVSIAGPLPEVIGHQATVVTTICNLVSNGLKFVPAGVKPQLRLWAERSEPRINGLMDRWIDEGRAARESDSEHLSNNPSIQPSSGLVRLWVEDNGIGIAPGDQGKVFGAFQRLHAKGTYPGTGLGLAIVRKGVERMGGRVGLESEVGKGSRFWVELRAA